MSNSTGDKAKLVNALDKIAAESITNRPAFSIELILAKSRAQKRIVAGVFIWQMRDMGAYMHLDVFNEVDEKTKMEEQDQLDQATDSMVHSERFAKDDGLWPHVVFDAVLANYDGRCKGSAQIKIACPELGTEKIISAKDVPLARFNKQKMFKEFMEAVQLLEREYAYDPWTEAIRRGAINPEKGGTVNFDDAMKELHGQKMLLAILDEFLHYGNRIKEGEVNVPGPTISEAADTDYVDVVAEKLKEMRAECTARIDKIKGVEVVFSVESERKRRVAAKKPATRKRAAKKPSGRKRAARPGGRKTTSE